MRHPVPIALAVLLALSLPVSAVGTAGSVGSAGSATVADSSTVQQSFQFQRSNTYISGDHAQLDGTPNRLAFEGDKTTAYATPIFDFGFAAASQDDSIRADYRTYAFENSFENIENETNRTEAVIAELEHLEDRIENLHERERAVVASHSAGEASEDEVVRTLARNYYEARELSRAMEQLANKSGDIVVDEQGDETITVSTMNSSFNGELRVFTSPLREQIGASLRGDEQSTPTITVESSDNGLILATITANGEFVREAVQYDNRDHDTYEPPETPFNIYQSVKDIYPWVSDNNGVSASRYHPANLYPVSIDHDQGNLFVIFDSRTDGIYTERQQLKLDRLPTDTEKQLEHDNLSVVLKSTPGNGPMKVTVIDPNSGVPVNASVSIDDQWTGETDANGERWLIPPADEFELTVQTESESLNATVTASY